MDLAEESFRAANGRLVPFWADNFEQRTRFRVSAARFNLMVGAAHPAAGDLVAHSWRIKQEGQSRIIRADLRARVTNRAV